MTGARLALIAGTTIVLATGGIGFLHTPAGRPILRAFLPTCPVGFGKDLTVAERDAAHAAALSTVRGDTPAASRPALGFALDTTSRADVDAWVAAHGVTCTEKGRTRRCPGVAAGTFGDRPEGEVSFQLDAHDRLVAVTWEVTGLGAVDSLALQRAAETSAKVAGEPVTTRGELDPDWLLEKKLRQRAVEYRFTDYRAQLITTHLANGRVKVREVYQSIPDAP